jgi:hypothetical protein
MFELFPMHPCHSRGAHLSCWVLYNHVSSHTPLSFPCTVMLTTVSTVRAQARAKAISAKADDAVCLSDSGSVRTAPTRTTSSLSYKSVPTGSGSVGAGSTGIANRQRRHVSAGVSHDTDDVSSLSQASSHAALRSAISGAVSGLPDLGRLGTSTSSQAHVR